MYGQWERANRTLGITLLSAAAMVAAKAETAATPDQLDEIRVTAERLGLMGSASTASEGIVVNDELTLTPAFRVGQLLETVPGLQVTSHSGEGKANQYLLRGYNLDHGTDLATFVDGMPVNEPTHAHGQGYTDLNFLIPELATNVTYTKGPYYAKEGDFASVGSVHINYLDALAPEISYTEGTLGYERFFGGGSAKLGEGNLLGALEWQHYNGPWVNPDELHKINAVLRYSAGDQTDGYSATAMYYHGLWNATTDQPERAIEEGLIGRYGSLNPSDGGMAQRTSLTAQFFKPVAGGELNASAYLFGNRLTLWNDFTHFLVDPVHGDQEEQHEDRTTIGGSIDYEHAVPIFGLQNDVTVGLATRSDFNDVSRLPTENRIVIPAADDPLNFSEADTVRLSSFSAYAQSVTHWTDWFRSVFGYRYDTQYGSDKGTNSGAASDHLLAPKGSLIFRPAEMTELYISAGRGFHSDDLRGVTAAQDAHVAGAPLIARQSGEEVGLRQQLTRAFTMTVSFYELSAQSETTYDPDAGVDAAGPGSRRRGYEVNLTYQALQWLEFYGSYSGNRARYVTPFDDGTGHVGEYLPNAPFATGSFNVYVKNLGPWSGSLGYRYLSSYPLSSDNSVQGHGYGIWSGDARYAIGADWSLGLGIYNLLNKKADAAEFWYVDRLQGEPAGGAPDVHIHPLEGISGRFTLTKSF
ncbi:MAG TPA: TonB-dependent receptor [Steroidobacteraceae bacterium]|nr:TonB-dependent receptor [Steroidobacteraceae bacterium]